MFITEQDYIQVSADALRIIQQATDDNRLLAERRAMDRIASYLDGRYDMQTAFTAEGEARNLDLVGLVADLALYFMVLSLPQKMGLSGESAGGKGGHEPARAATHGRGRRTYRCRHTLRLRQT